MSQFSTKIVTIITNKWDIFRLHKQLRVREDKLDLLVNITAASFRSMKDR